MRLKPVPAPPEDLAAVRRARRAVPLVPSSEADCCARLLDRLDLPARDAARTWLTFLRALDLIERTPRGYARTRSDVGREALADAFTERVFGAREALDLLDDRPRSLPELFEAFEPHVPPWERHRRPNDWRPAWRDRLGRLLGWLALLGLAEQVDAGYRRATRARGS